ncbi:MAG TPA: hypothetical protein VI076_10655 [Actinopolymorphaceae bacterium]
MSWLRRLLPGRTAEPAPTITLDIEARTAQLEELERQLDRLVEVMRANTERMANPGWRERVAEYKRISGQAYTLRRGGFTREQLLDLAFEVRPVMSGELPSDVEAVRPLQDELMAAADALRTVLPQERAGG